MSELYADASALAKLLIHEPESAALLAFVGSETRGAVSSAIIRVELTRAVRMRNPAGASELRELLDHLTLMPVDAAVLAAAAQLADARLRSLDAIHLATAIMVGATDMLVYDGDLAAGAEAAGIRAVAPGR